MSQCDINTSHVRKMIKLFSKLILTKVFASEEYHLSYEAVSGDARGLKQEKMYPPETPMSMKWTTVIKNYETPSMCQRLCLVQDFFFLRNK